jgi:hypothetical protein
MSVAFCMRLTGGKADFEMILFQVVSRGEDSGVTGRLTFVSTSSAGRMSGLVQTSSGGLARRPVRGHSR